MLGFSIVICGKGKCSRMLTQFHLPYNGNIMRTKDFGRKPLCSSEHFCASLWKSTGWVCQIPGAVRHSLRISILPFQTCNYAPKVTDTRHLIPAHYHIRVNLGIQEIFPAIRILVLQKWDFFGMICLSNQTYRSNLCLSSND